MENKQVHKKTVHSISTVSTATLCGLLHALICARIVSTYTPQHPSLDITSTTTTTTNCIAHSSPQRNNSMMPLKFPLARAHLARRLHRHTGIPICQQHPKAAKSSKSSFDPDVLLQNIVAIRTKGWSSAFSLWGEPSAKDRAAADDAFRHAQMSPREVVSPNTDIVDSHPKAERKALIKKALQDGNLSFGFSAGGLLFPYLIGACVGGFACMCVWGGGMHACACGG